MKIKKSNIFIFMVMIINTFFSLPLILYNVYRKKRMTFLVALFFGVLGFYFMPESDGFDIARYFRTVVDSEYRTIFFRGQKDFFALALVKLLVFFKLPSNYLPAIVGFIVYYFLFKTYRKVIDINNISKYKYFLFFCVTYVSIPLIAYTGIRSVTGLVIFVYSIFNEKKYVKILGSILVIFIHTSMIVPSVIYLFCLFIFNFEFKYYKQLTIAAMLLGIILTPEFLRNLAIEINKFNIIYISPNYFIGKWGNNYLESIGSFKAMMMNSFFIKFRLVLLLYYNLFIYKKIKQSENAYTLNNFLLFFSCFCIVIYRYFVFWERYSNIVILGAYFFSIKCKIISSRNLKEKVLLSLIVLYFFLSALYDIRKYYISFYLSYGNIFKISFFNVILNTINNYI